ncbi:hypothetical protein Tco_1058851, partial [Tanacetum coccineum]
TDKTNITVYKSRKLPTNKDKSQQVVNPQSTLVKQSKSTLEDKKPQVTISVPVGKYK